MKTKTAQDILKYIQKNKGARPHDLIREFQITPAAIHRHLRKLVQSGKIKKTGTSPHVFYILGEEVQIRPAAKSEVEFEKYLYISPVGEMLDGVIGFETWAKSIGEEKRIQSLILEYQKIRSEADHHLKNGFIEATERLKNIFREIALKKVFYMDFYSLPKFGKTKLGQLVLHGKQAQSTKIIREIAQIIQVPLKELCHREKIEALAWIPHSLPRKVQFLKEIESNLLLDLPKIHIQKVYSGQVPVAQKSLSKLEDRIINASKTMMIREPRISARKILLIDDAVGSGATLNEAAKKLIEKGAQSVIGFAVVGSYKGFEVIREV